MSSIRGILYIIHFEVFIFLEIFNRFLDIHLLLIPTFIHWFLSLCPALLARGICEMGQ